MGLNLLKMAYGHVIFIYRLYEKTFNLSTIKSVVPLLLSVDRQYSWKKGFCYYICRVEL